MNFKPNMDKKLRTAYLKRLEVIRGSLGSLIMIEKGTQLWGLFNNKDHELMVFRGTFAEAKSCFKRNDVFWSEFKRNNNGTFIHYNGDIVLAQVQSPLTGA